MNNRTIRIGGALLCILAAALCASITADQQFFDLPPSAPEALTPLEAGTVYEQTFLIQRKTISRLGLYMAPRTSAIPKDATVTISLVRQGISIASSEIPAVFIESGGPSYVRFDTPIETQKGEFLTVRISVPESISGKIALRMRPYDTLFSKHDTRFEVNGIPETSVVAYKVFELIRPTFLQQLGGLIACLGIFILFSSTIHSHPHTATVILLAVIALLQGISAWQARMSYIQLSGLTFLLLLCTWYIFRISGRSHLGAIFGACVFSLSSWLALHIITGGTIYGMLNVRDTLLDPNQIAVSHSAGAYIGIFAFIASLIGIGIWVIRIVRGQYLRAQADTAAILLLAICVFLAFVPSPLATGQAVIGVALALAFLASGGLDGLHTFLGKSDRIATILIWILCSIAILDLMHITSLTFTYGLGI